MSRAPIPTAKLRAAVQAARRRNGLEDDEYYRLLSEVAGRTVTSTTDLRDWELTNALDRLNRGRPKRPAKRGKAGKYSPRSQGTPADKARAMWITMHHAGIVTDPSETALDHYVRRMVRIDEKGRPLPEGVRFGGTAMLAVASDRQINALLNGLRGWFKRVYKERLKADLDRILARQQQTGESSRDATVALLDAGEIVWWGEFLEWFGLEQREEWT